MKKRGQSPSHGTYRDAGVDIDAGHDAVRLMRASVQSTWGSAVLCSFGSFAGLYELEARGEGGGVLAVTIDGVGTKLKVATMCGRHKSVGMDLVNHCTNDLLAQRARPLLFADYFATSVLEPNMVAEAVEGMAEACRAVNCSLIAGETAEMPGVYLEGELDLVGCMIGVARKTDILDLPAVSPGDVLIGLDSSGLHTNGYSLARRLLFDVAGWDVDTSPPELDCTVGEELLKVHREYFTVLSPVLSDSRIHGLAHITGGGLYDNVARIMPHGCEARIEKAVWDPPAVFGLLTSIGNLPDEEAYRVFNMGIGMVVAADAECGDEFVRGLGGPGWAARVIGRVARGDTPVFVE